MNDQMAARVPSIETFSGHEFTLNGGEIRLIDVATALSRLCRYVGHGRRFYSVAEHAVEVAAWILRKYDNPWLALTGLHHDDWETYFSDVAGPWKGYFPDYKAVEKLGTRRVADTFKLVITLTGEWPSVVKCADARICRDEKKHLFPRSTVPWNVDNLVPLGIRLWPFCPPIVAKWRWLRMHRKLTKMLGR